MTKKFSICWSYFETFISKYYPFQKDYVYFQYVGVYKQVYMCMFCMLWPYKALKFSHEMVVLFYEKLMIYLVHQNKDILKYLVIYNIQW